jgi:hypothetical protein
MSDKRQPAFPTIINREVLRGMTLRDYFAAQIIQGMYANPDHRYNTHPTDALEAYAMADAMLHFREQA